MGQMTTSMENVEAVLYRNLNRENTYKHIKI